MPQVPELFGTWRADQESGTLPQYPPNLLHALARSSLLLATENASISVVAARVLSFLETAAFSAPLSESCQMVSISM